MPTNLPPGNNKSATLFAQSGRRDGLMERLDLVARAATRNKNSARSRRPCEKGLQGRWDTAKIPWRLTSNVTAGPEIRAGTINALFHKIQRRSIISGRARRLLLPYALRSHPLAPGIGSHRARALTPSASL